MNPTRAYSAACAASPLASAQIQRRNPTEHESDVKHRFSIEMASLKSE